MQANLLQAIERYLKNNSLIIFGYLFGSYAKGEQRDNSDIDLALYLQKENLDTLLQINYELSKITQKDIDIVVLNSVKNIYLTDAILRDGIILKDSSQRIDFELKMQENILDFKEFRRYIDAI